MYYCTKCGNELNVGTQFCSRCGEAISLVQQPPTQQSPVQQSPVQQPPMQQSSVRQQPYQQLSAQQPPYRQPDPSRGSHPFVEKYLGIIVLLVFLLCLVLLMVIADGGRGIVWSQTNLRNIFTQFFLYGMIAIGTVTATRIGGPDFSIGAMMSLAGAIIAGIIVNGGGTIVGMLLAIAVCGFFGLVNGAIISLLRMPSIIVTMITSSLIFAIVYIYTGAETVPLGSEYAHKISMFGYIYLPFVLCAIIAIGTLLFVKSLCATKNRKANSLMQQLARALGYVLVAVIAVFAGYAHTVRLGAAVPRVGADLTIPIILIFSAVQSSKLLNNNLVALGYGLVVALILALSGIAMSIINVNIYLMQIIQAGMALIMLALAAAAQGGGRSLFLGADEE